MKILSNKTYNDLKFNAKRNINDFNKYKFDSEAYKVIVGILEELNLNEIEIEQRCFITDKKIITTINPTNNKLKIQIIGGKYE